MSGYEFINPIKIFIELRSCHDETANHWERIGWECWFCIVKFKLNLITLVWLKSNAFWNGWKCFYMAKINTNNRFNIIGFEVVCYIFIFVYNVELFYHTQCNFIPFFLSQFLFFLKFLFDFKLLNAVYISVIFFSEISNWKCSTCSENESKCNNEQCSFVYY